MPLALGHLAVGLLTSCAIEKPKTTTRKSLFFLFLLANSPDMDVAISWLLTGSPWLLHRTFTHSILFAILMAAVFSNLHRLIRAVPKLSYNWCYGLVSTHVIADYLISPWGVAFLWPVPIQPLSLNGILDHVGQFATLAREIEVIFICLFTYLFVKTLRTAVVYLYKLLLPA
jgi:membrane-bound metal-dependent hydrolase YbcI (DUF457 family)